MRDAVTKQRLATEDARQTAAALAEGQKGRRKAVLREAALPSPCTLHGPPADVTVQGCAPPALMPSAAGQLLS